MAVGQRKRDKKVSKGTGRGAKPMKLTELEKVLLGKGALDRIKPVAAPRKAPRRG